MDLQIGRAAFKILYAVGGKEIGLFVFGERDEIGGLDGSDAVKNGDACVGLIGISLQMHLYNIGCIGQRTARLHRFCARRCIEWDDGGVAVGTADERCDHVSA